MSKKPEAMKVGDVVQISPDLGSPFGGCFMLVTEPKSWGAQGVIQIPGKGRAFYRCDSADMVYIGSAEWLAADEAATHSGA